MQLDSEHIAVPFLGIGWRRIRGISRHLATPQALRVGLLIVAYGIIAALLTWPLIAQINRSVTSSIDPVDNIWRIGWAQHQLLHAPSHLFTGNTFYPFPDSYLFDGSVLGAAILTLPLAIVGVPPLAIYNIAVLLSLMLSALAMYALARRFGAVPIAAFGAGAIYAFAPMHLDRVGHIAFLSAQWFPLTLLFLDRLLETPRTRDALALAVCLAMAALSSQYYAIYLVFLVPPFLVIMLVRRPEARQWRVWLHLVGAGGLALLVVAPMALTFRRVQVEYGLDRTYGQVTYYAATLSDFITADDGNLLWGRVTAPLRAHGTYTFERVMFPGLIALTLAAIGAWVGRRRAWEQFLAVLVVIAGLLALGPELRATPQPNTQPLLRHLPYDLLYWHVPGFDSMRVPARFGTLFLLGIAGLAAAGFTAVLGWVAGLTLPRPRLAAAFPIVASMAVLAGIGVEYASAPLRLSPLEAGAVVPPVYRWFARQPDARIIELPIAIPDHENTEYVAVREEYYSLVHGHPTVNGYANVIPKGFRALVLDMKQFPAPRAVTLLQGIGVTHVVIHFDQLSAPDRNRLEDQLRAGVDGLTRMAQFSDTVVYAVAPSAQLATLRTIIPPGASVLLSREDPQGSGAYMAMLGYVLRDHPLYAHLRVDFGTGYRGAPVAGQEYDYAILYPREDPAALGFADADVVWQDGVVRVYRAQSSRYNGHTTHDDNRPAF